MRGRAGRDRLRKSALRSIGAIHLRNYPAPLVRVFDIEFMGAPGCVP
jgi:hypothetical protein